jgi:hypothetical protein
MSLSLVYLSYVPFGKGYLQSFIDSYKSKQPGLDHKLIILFNGYKEEIEIDPFLVVLRNAGISYEYILSPEKFDIAAYFNVARVLQSEFIAFVNTYSIILHDNWLASLYQNVIKTGVGCVSATGSWGDFQHNDSYEKMVKDMKRGRISLNNFKKILFFRYNYHPGVGPHLRTNAFMIRRATFITLSFESVKPAILNLFFNISKTKLKSLCFEHGKNSLTNQLSKMGLLSLIVDRHGKSYNVECWKEAKTFWVSEQENLLVSDNQTLKYQHADENSRLQFTYAAWGF